MNLRWLIVALMVVLAGCATLDRAHDVPVPVPVPMAISENTWRQVDSDIVAASQTATEQVKTFARGSMEHWRALVYERTETNFIPWFSSYWTQEWLSIKVSWYTLNAGGQLDPSAKRLAAYLQEQYHNRVLAPVAVEIDPEAIMGQATAFYVELLGKRLLAIGQRYGIPTAQLDRRLKDIPAITLAPPPANNASLYQVVHASPLDKLPAYLALVDRIHTAQGGTGTVLSDEGILSVAKQTNEKLESSFASRGAASAVATAVGRVAGAMISLGVAGVRAITQESDRADTEAQIRKSLGAAFDKAWLKLLDNPTSGVMAGVYYLSGQIEGGLGKTLEVPLPVSRALPQSGEAPLPETDKAGETPVALWRPDQ